MELPDNKSVCTKQLKQTKKMFKAVISFIGFALAGLGKVEAAPPAKKRKHKQRTSEKPDQLLVLAEASSRLEDEAKALNTKPRLFAWRQDEVLPVILMSHAGFRRVIQDLQSFAREKRNFNTRNEDLQYPELFVPEHNDVWDLRNYFSREEEAACGESGITYAGLLELKPLGPAYGDYYGQCTECGVPLVVWRGCHFCQQYQPYGEAFARSLTCWTPEHQQELLDDRCREHGGPDILPPPQERIEDESWD